MFIFLTLTLFIESASSSDANDAIACNSKIAPLPSSGKKIVNSIMNGQPLHQNKEDSLVQDLMRQSRSQQHLIMTMKQELYKLKNKKKKKKENKRKRRKRKRKNRKLSESECSLSSSSSSDSSSSSSSHKPGLKKSKFNPPSHSNSHQ